MVLVGICIIAILLSLITIKMNCSKFSRINYYEDKIKRWSGTPMGDYFEKKLRELER